jgi:RNA polymerase sigma factor (sigma-70 family)
MMNVNGYVVVEKHGVTRPHQRQGKNVICDVPGCNLHDDVMVARVLSKEFSVDTNGKPRLESQIVLSEVVISDPKIGYHKPIDEAIIEARENSAPKRPLTISMLNKIKRPLEHGYSFEEVKTALAAYIGCHANRYCSNHFSTDDGEQMGMIGIWNALRTDRAIAPFANHTFKHIQTSIRRAAFTSGLIKHGERDGDKYGTKGIQTGIEEDAECYSCKGTGEGSGKKCAKCEGMGKIGDKECKTCRGYGEDRVCNKCEGTGKVDQKIFGGLRSADAPIVEDVNVYDVTIEDEQTTPYEATQQTEDKRILSGRLRAAIEKADLTPQQVRVVALKYGMTDLVENPFDPETETAEHEAWARGELELNGTRIAKVLGCTRQRIGQQDKKCIKKLASVAEDLGLEKFLD